MIEELKKEILNGENTNIAFSENGAKMNATTGKNLLDMSFKIPSMRTGGMRMVSNLSKLAFMESPELFIRFMFYLRDIRGGIGERDSFRNSFLWLSENQPEIAAKLLPFIPEYGRWDDLVWIAIHTKNEQVMETAVKIIANQMKEDKGRDNVSLLGKWLPSVNAGLKSASEAKTLIKLINKVYGTKINAAYYRKTVSLLRKKANVVERNIAAKTYGDINYEAVPSLANTRYARLFLKYDENRRRAYLDSLAKGDKKINAAASFPHDVWKLIRREPQTAEQMWKSLPDFVKGDAKTLVVRDGSGSMTCNIPNSTTSALDVASALCVYFSERMTGEFKNKFITFSSRPQLVELGDNTSLEDKMWLLDRYDDCSNTNIEATFQLVLDTAVNNNLKQEELPTSLLIVSDMEFDYATQGHPDDKLFTTIRKKWEAAGYQLPRLVFWNVNSRTGAIPMTQNKNGVILISGFSAALCNMVLSEETDPYLALVKVLNGERYNPIIDVIKDDLTSL